MINKNILNPTWKEVVEVKKHILPHVTLHNAQSNLMDYILKYYQNESVCKILLMYNRKEILREGLPEKIKWEVKYLLRLSMHDRIDRLHPDRLDRFLNDIRKINIKIEGYSVRLDGSKLIDEEINKKINWRNVYEGRIYR